MPTPHSLRNVGAGYRLQFRGISRNMVVQRGNADLGSLDQMMQSTPSYLMLAALALAFVLTTTPVPVCAWLGEHCQKTLC
jgi:hypothetical protein